MTTKEEILENCKESIGIPKKRMISEEIETAKVMKDEGYSLREIAGYLELSTSTIVRRLQAGNYPNYGNRRSREHELSKRGARLNRKNRANREKPESQILFPMLQDTNDNGDTEEKARADKLERLLKEEVNKKRKRIEENAEST